MPDIIQELADPGVLTAEQKSNVDTTGFRESNTRKRPGEDARLWAQLYVADLPIYWTFHRGQRVEKWRSRDGRRWRHSGTIVVSPFASKRIRVHLLAGFNAEDLNFLQKMIQFAITDGLGEAWEQQENADRVPSWCFTWSRQVLPTDDTAKIRFCLDPACLDYFHRSDIDVCHVHDRIVVDREPDSSSDAYDGHDGYSIGVERFDPDPLWRVAVETGGFQGSPDRMASFVNDVKWMSTTADRLNDPSNRITSTKLVLPCAARTSAHAGCAGVV